MRRLQFFANPHCDNRYDHRNCYGPNRGVWDADNVL
jgi:hypothetical protein